jgi:hypothetical protein
VYDNRIRRQRSVSEQLANFAGRGSMRVRPATHSPGVLQPGEFRQRSTTTAAAIIVPVAGPSRPQASRRTRSSAECAVFVTPEANRPTFFRHSGRPRSPSSPLRGAVPA